MLSAPYFQFQYAEMSLAHAMVTNQEMVQDELQEPVKAVKNKEVSSVPYLIAIGRLFILQKQYEKAKVYLSKAVKEEVEVRNFFEAINFIESPHS